MNKEPEKLDSLEEISNFIFLSKYSRFNEKLGRRETWNEAVHRVESMHLKKYNFLPESDREQVKKAFDCVREKLVVPSMRSLQFGGKAIETKNERIYNCAVRHVDSLRSFSEIFYLLLCGCGVGLGLSKHFLGRIPDLVGEKDKNGTVLTYQVLDSIEGWADSIEVLLMCYFKNTPLTGRKIVFDYSKIRPEGSLLKTGGGKAPGHKGLKHCHFKIKELLDHIVEFKKQKRAKSIDVYDIIMHSADAVLSGGVRRSSTSVIFDKDDQDMINAKIKFKVDKVFNFNHISDETVGGQTNKIYEGKVNFEGKRLEIQVKEYELKDLNEKSLVSWIHLFPHRARSNNSVLLIRSETSEKEFSDILERTKQFGEPGFVWGNDKNQLFNPCIHGEEMVKTNKGDLSIKEVSERFNSGENFNIFSYNDKSEQIEEKELLDAALTRENAEIIEIELENGEKLRCTPDHEVFVENLGWKKAKDLDSEDVLLKIN